ncbi:MAG: hypothetical protein D8B54_01695 [Catonella sp.]|nr:MAG: hypothetical protein D8B54_01695 [Catonella sp.]
MYVYYYENAGELDACDPALQLASMLNSSIDYRMEESYISSNDATYLKSLAHDVPKLLADALEQPLQFTAINNEIRLWIKVDSLGHYDIDFIDDSGSDVLVARISWVEPLR